MPIFNRSYVGMGAETPQGSLQREGARLNVEINPTKETTAALLKEGKALPQPIIGMALIDTGASVTAIDKDTLEKSFNIQPVGISEVATPAGKISQNIYPISLSFPGTELPNFAPVFVVACELNTQGIVALIGRDILSHCLLVFNGKGAIISISI